MKLIVNVDAAEGVSGSQLDIDLVDQVDAVNIALGGHAGDPVWSRELADRAAAKGKRVHLHPGYADRENFGRKHLAVSWEELSDSLSLQRSVLPEINSCKFHGAIYNRAVIDAGFAVQLVKWCRSEAITELVTPAGSCLADAAGANAITVLREAFVDRRYVIDAGRLTLQARHEPGAVIETVGEALAQVVSIASGKVALADGAIAPIECDTICIHGDGQHALELASRLSTLT